MRSVSLTQAVKSGMLLVASYEATGEESLFCLSNSSFSRLSHLDTRGRYIMLAIRGETSPAVVSEAAIMKLRHFAFMSRTDGLPPSRGLVRRRLCKWYYYG